MDLRRLADDIRALGIDEDPYLHPGLDGGHATPRLRSPGGEGPGETLRRLISEVGSYETVPANLDLAHEGRVLALVERPRAHVLWSPQPAYKVAIPGVRRAGHSICCAGALTSVLAFRARSQTDGTAPLRTG